MCPACLASLGMMAAAALASASAVTALVATKIRPKKPEASTQTHGENQVATEDRIQG